ncbi:TPA: peptidylprolyl isomerase PrsA [Streptococcus agalactiae]|uniref:Foldase protein PrsA n=3 Tax=Streptococcus agalactiae TaxID=1311 RepID=PRSA_STRA1|nr:MULTISPECIES: peptidylprolyl isomerase PrsA [Streptococcus]Q3K1P9.1 RecName: Full=Foldase protein PrsA; Flags: Precursor [Streptococcus agalactiae A909]AHN30298.1 foldase [Streptococcus agalactiae 138P]EJZ02671.1 foldase protein PrsA [Streptococcus agalactiae STIR-CD-17]EPU01759.1 foldase PrsA [Streptococcus agalactiae STIR-CD-09]EPU05813.1 foldase PrsA [Streptococcus agalactiae STIR-CD-13]EPU23456.1 foldase PrsA [Streptococcus agalactiae LMG 14609]EPW83708.1 foldase PrsA [Streptococcus a
MKTRSKLAAGFLTLMSVATLAACSGKTSNGTNVVTMKGDTITVSDFYDQVKTSKAAQQSMLTLILSRVFDTQYGDKVSDKKVSEAYNKTAKGYGNSFSSALSQAGLTPEGYKQQIRTTMLVEYAVKEAAKKELTEANYKEAYKNYTPETSVQVIKLDAEDKAKSVLKDVKADGADFAKIAKEKTTATDKKVEYKFDSAGTSLPKEVMSAAFKLDKNGVSDVVSTVDSTTYKTSYYIIKVTDKTEKKSDWKSYKNRLKEVILKDKTSDRAFQNKVISKALEKANVKIKDKAFAGILSQYATTSGSSSLKK